MITPTIVECQTNPPIYALILSHPHITGVYDYYPTYIQAQSALIAILQNPAIPNYSFDTSRPNSFTHIFAPTQDARQKLPPVSIKLSDTAHAKLTWQSSKVGYGGHSIYTGPTLYLQALLKANPLPDHWQDNRPEYLKDADLERLTRPLRQGGPALPLWSEAITGDTRQHLFSLRPLIYQQIAPALLELSQHFFITPYRATLNPPHGTKNRAASVIEAIALDYLHPAQQPPYNPRPVGSSRYKDYHRYGAKGRYEFPF